MENSSLIIRSSCQLLSFFIALLAIGGGQNVVRGETCPMLLTPVDVGNYQSGGTYYVNDFFIVGDSYGLERRSFIAFQIPSFAQPIASADLWLVPGVIVISGDGPETIEFNEVTNTLAAVQQANSPPAIFNDLADGAFYGAYSFVPNIDNHSVRIPLNAVLISKLQGAQGTNLILGARLSSLNTTSDYENVYLYPEGVTSIALAVSFQANDDPLQVLTQP